MAMRTAASKMAGTLGLRVQSNGGAFQRLMATVADGLKYQPSHEWVKPEGDVGVIGISDFAQVRDQGPPPRKLAFCVSSF